MDEEAGGTTMGLGNYHAHADFGFRFAKVDRFVEVYRADRVIAYTDNSTTYTGAYVQAPVHDSHWIDLSARLEPTGITAVKGFDPESLQSIYTLEPGYSVFIYPRYRYCSERAFDLPSVRSVRKNDRTQFAVGPLFTPDFKKYGFMVEIAQSGAKEGVSLFWSLSAGLIVRGTIPEGAMFLSPGSEEDDYETVEDEDLYYVERYNKSTVQEYPSK